MLSELVMNAEVNNDRKPPLGGWLPSIKLSREQAVIFNAIADELLPPTKDWPAPSEVNVVAFFVRYVTPSPQEPAWYPFLGELEVKEKLEALGKAFLESSSAQRVETLQTLERDDASFFAHVRDVIYFGYYSRPGVISAMNDNLEAAKDYRLAPQPYGYGDVLGGWDQQLLQRARERGTYKRTEDVERLTLPAGLATGSALAR